MENPFLQKDLSIRWSTLTPEHIENGITQALRDTQVVVDVIAARSSDSSEPLTYENTFAALNEGMEPLDRAWSLVEHLDAVCNSPELREAYNRMLPKVTEFSSKIPLNAALWKTLKSD